MDTFSQERCFTNKLRDYDSSLGVDISQDTFKKRCLDYVQIILTQQTVTPDDYDGGLYVGITGIGYMCYYLSQHPAFLDKKHEFLQKSKFYLQHALKFTEQPRLNTCRSSKTAFLLGIAGTYAVASVVARATENDESGKHLESYTSLAKKLLPQDFLGCGSDELLVGRAGYLSGILFLQKEFGNQILPEKMIFELCDATVKSGMAHSIKVKSPCPLMYSYYKTEYLGAAHGLSAILQMLLSFPNYLDQNPEAEMKIKESVEFLLSTQTPSGTFPCEMKDINIPNSRDDLVHWCHGSPGVVYLMAKAYLHWKDEKYLNSCLLCGENVWKSGLLKKGPGICHGVAGNGYVFLLLYRLTKDEKHLHRAVQFSDFLYSKEFKSARTPDSPLSLYEGLAGTVCFLADMLQVEKAHFPFFDIF